VRDDVGEDVGGKVGHQVAAHGGHFVRALCHPRERTLVGTEPIVPARKGL
jgi:hypothetical protein